MSIKAITTILDRHCIPYMIQNNRIMVDSMEAFTTAYLDITDYNRAQLMAWLGY